MSAGDLALNILLTAQSGGVTSVISGLAGQLNGINPVLAGVTAVAVGVGAAVIGFGVASVKAAGDFQTGMTQLVTGAGESQAAIGMVSDGILKMAVDTGTSTQQLTSGMYMIESAGYHGAAGLNVLQVAAEGAKVGNADLGVTANALTTILTDYHMKGQDAAAAMNGLTATVQSGKMKLQDLAGAMGSVLPLASSLGVSFPQVAGAIATMTNAGMSAQRASMNLANTIRALAAPGSSAAKSLKQVGLTAQQLHDSLTKGGLTAAIQLVEEHVGKKFPAGSVQAVAAFKAIMGGATGYNVALMLGGKNMQTFEGNVKTITGAMHNGTGAVTGWADVQKDFNFKMDQAKEAVNALMIKVGTALLPVLSNLMSKVSPLIMQFSDWITKNHVIENTVAVVTVGINLLGDGIQKGVQIVQTMSAAIQNVIAWYNQWKGIILSVAGAILIFFLPALIQTGVQAVIAGAKLAVSFVRQVITTGVESVVAGAKTSVQFVGSIIKAGIEGWQSAGKLAVYIGQMIASGAQAVVAGAKIAISFVAQLIASGAKAIWAGIQIASKFVASLVMSGVQAVIAGARMLASLVPALISTVTEGLIAAATAIPGLIAGFIGWAIAGWAAAAATIAATWPILLIILAIALLVVGIILLVQHWGQVTAFLKTIWQAFTTWLMAALHAIGQFFVNVWNGIISFLKAAWAWIVNAAKIAFMILLIIIMGPIVLIAILIYTHWNQIKAFLASAWAWVVSTATGLWQKVLSVFTGAWSGIQGAMRALWNNLVSFVSGWPAQALQWGINLISGFLNGIKNAAAGIGNFINSNVLGPIKSFLGFGSPTEKGEGQHIVVWGAGMVYGFVAGMQSAMPLLNAQVSHMIQAPNSAAYGGRGSGISAGNAFARNSGQTIIVQVQPAKADINMDGRKVGDGVMKYVHREIHLQAGVRNK